MVKPAKHLIRNLSAGLVVASMSLVPMSASADEPPRSDADLSDFVELIWFFPMRIGTAVSTGAAYVISAPVRHLAGTEAEAYDDLVTRPLEALSDGTGR